MRHEIPEPQDSGVGEAFGGDPAWVSGAVDGGGAAGGFELGEVVRPVACVFVAERVQGQSHEALEEIVELVFVSDVGPALAADGVDGVLVEAASAFEDAVR